MNITNQGKWAEYKQANESQYGKDVMRLAEGWADAVEAKMAEGATLEDIAEEARRSVGIPGMSGEQVEYTVAALADCWEHGLQLQTWFEAFSAGQ